MEDEAIVDLYWRRDESAIEKTKEKYDRYLTKTAYNVVGNLEDCEECVNDTYFRAWNSIPPQRPKTLSVYLGKIARQAAIDCYRKHSSQKRGGSEFAVSLEELEDCVPGGNTPEREIDTQLLSVLINRYLQDVPQENRILFVRRYFYCDSIKEIAKRNGYTQSKVKSILFRIRTGLKEYLEKEGFVI